MKGSIKMENLDGFLGSSKKIQKTKIVPLRWFANGISSVGTTCLVKAVYLDEDGDYGLKYRFYSKVWKVANFFYSRWGTYYELDMAAWKEQMSGPEWGDYDSDGHAYWEDFWNEDPLTGDAWRIKEKDIFETQVDFE
jgi:hypothetical protein